MDQRVIVRYGELPSRAREDGAWRHFRTLKNIAHKKTPALEKPLLDRFFPEKR
jgi:hypothetical protein